MRAPMLKEYVYRVRRAIRGWPLRMDETVYVAGHHLPRHLHPRPVLIAFLEGGWLHSVGDDTRHIRPGEIVFLPALTAHALTFAGRLGRAFSIEFEESPARDALPRRPLHTSDPRLVALTLDAYKSFSSDQPLTGGRLAAALALALDTIDRRQNKFSASQYASWLTITLDRVRTSVADGVRMSAIAREVGVNAAHMSRRFRQVFGESMSAFRDRVRLEQASRALLGSDDTISSIAAALGFCDHAHLTRTFKRATSMTPSQFRRVVTDTCLRADQLSTLESRHMFVQHAPTVSGIRVV